MNSRLEVVNVADRWLKSILISLGINLLASFIFYLATQNPSLTLLVAAVIMLPLLLAIYIIYRVKKYYDVCKLLGIESARLRTKEDWDKYYLNSKNIRAMFARGGGVFGTDTDPMYQNVKKLPSDWDGTIRVLIMHPDSKFVEDRANELDLEVNDVGEQCRRVMKNITHLREKHHAKIMGKYYHTKPFLRFVLFDNFGFFSFPAWGKKYKPYPYHFMIKPGPNSLFEALSIYFEQIWSKAEEGEKS